MNSITLETVLQLEPILDPLVVPESSAEDNWLENNSADLVDTLDSKPPAEKLSETQTSDSVYHCESLRVRATAAGYEIETANGNETLCDGDIVALPKIQFRVVLQKEHVVPLETPTETISSTISDPDDIWSTGESQQETLQTIDPFAKQMMSNVGSLADSKTVQNNPPSFTQQDPLNFLYENKVPNSHSPQAAPSLGMEDYAQPTRATTPNYFVDTNNTPDYPSQQHNHVAAQPSAPEISQQQGNVLQDLGIDPDRSTIINKQYDAGKVSYSEQSPMDMLDEYLTVDEEIMPQHSSSYPNTQIPVQNRRQKGLLDSVKKVINVVRK